jgi:hypothetical protein
MQDYIRLIKKGDTIALEKLMKSDMTVTTDGGQKIKIVSAFTAGAQAATQLLTHVFNTYQASLLIHEMSINHQPALVFLQDQFVVNCQVFEVDPVTAQITRVFSIVDPEKLKNIKLN